MKHVGLSEVTAQLSTLLDDVARGEEITIVRDGQAVARLVAPAPLPTLAPDYPADVIEQRRAALHRMRAAARGLFDDVSHDEIKTWIDEGRG